MLLQRESYIKVSNAIKSNFDIKNYMIIRYKDVYQRLSKPLLHEHHDFLELRFP